MTATPLSRRTLLARTAAAGLGIAVVGSAETVFGASPVSAARAGGKAGGKVGYGPLLSDPFGRLALPRGFSYKLIAQAGVTTLETGEPTPDRPDGTAAFPRANGRGSVLVQNHEIGSYSTAPGLSPVPLLAGYVYDPGAGGGTTNIEVDARGNRVREYVSLAGTNNNCAGGVTPWGTWLTCEETEQRKGGVFLEDHGYVFEVHPTDDQQNRDPQPIRCLGRYAHEAAAVDPDTGIVYLTEDASGPHGLLYRWTPPAGLRPRRAGAFKALSATAGTLAALKAVDARGDLVPDLSVATRIGQTYRAEWVTVPDRDAQTVSTRKQFSYPEGKAGEGLAGAITRSRKLEGAWWGDDGFYFVASFARTADGSLAQHDGQVWFYDPKTSRIRLVLRFGFTPTDQNSDTDGPDNITVSPYGGLFLAEDGEGKQHLVGATSTGKTFTFAENQLPGDEEFTAPNFSPDGQTLFANVQIPGHTFAITGPFREV